MDPNFNPEAPPRQKVPLDGVGPRGLPECYYTSRVRNSTFRYVRFINKLRARETEERIGTENLIRDNKHKQCNEFFACSDRKNLINKVSYRVDLCLQAYEEDLQRKREKLKDLLTIEEEYNTRKLVEQVQAGPELIWQAKKDRLAYLLNKRRLEHEAKHSAPPLSKATHLLPCLTNIRTRESKEIQLYQIREKQMRREAEKEMEKMWHDVAMKEAEALSARMEYDEIERVRRQRDCNAYNDHQLELKRIQRAKEREELKEQMLQMNRDIEEVKRKIAEEERELQEKTAKTHQAKEEMLREREETVAKKNAETKLVKDLWDGLTASTVGKNEAKVDEDLKRRKKRDVNECNVKMAQLKQNIAKVKDNNEQLIQQEGDRLRDEADLKRCQRRKWSERTKAADAAANYKTFLEKQASMKEEPEQLEYERQVNAQLDALVKQKELTEAQARKLYQNDLKEQMAYNKLLRERARQEELDQIRKSEIATKEYYKEMEEMLRRPFYSNAVHPFMQQMVSGLKIEKCPCTKPNYCADPKPDPSINHE